MKSLFFFFTIFILLLLELYLGTLTLYIPLMWMGFFYFAVCRYPAKLLLISGLILAIILDTVLYQRLWMPDIFIFAGIFYMSWRYRDFWSLSIWSGGVHGCCLMISAYTIQTLFAAFSHGFSGIELVNSASQMTALMPIAFLLQTMLIFVTDKIQKKLRFEKCFVADRMNDPISIYRRRGEYSR